MALASAHLAPRQLSRPLTQLNVVAHASTARATSSFGTHRKLTAVEWRTARDERALAVVFAEQFGHAGQGLGPSFTESVGVLGA